MTYRFALVTVSAATSTVIASPLGAHHLNFLRSLRSEDDGKSILPSSDIEPCKGQSLKWCNTSLHLEDRVQLFVDTIPVEEMYALFGNTAGGSKTTNLPPYQWWNEALHGVGDSPGVSFQDPTPYATSFPQVCLTGATFDKELFAQVGDTIGKEGRAMANSGRAGLTFWAPNVNIAPVNWGREQEVPTVDTQHMAIYAAIFIRSMQNNSMDPTRLRVSSCAKHYQGYALENWGGFDRQSLTAEWSEKDLVEVLSPPFEAAYHPEGGAASGSMCSYNAVTSAYQGVSFTAVPSCANGFLINKIARGKWKFNGYVTSDCGAVDGVYARHNYTNTTANTCKEVLQAGMDIDCGGFMQKNLKAAHESGVVATGDMKAALMNQFRVLFRLGVFDPAEDQPYKKLGPQDVNTPEAKALAQQVAVEGIVLLNRDAEQFPFSPASIKKLAVMGPNAKNTAVQLGNYYGHPEKIITVVEGLSTYATVDYTQGTTIDQASATEFSDACALASDTSKADAVVLVVGNDEGIAAEGHDRTRLDMPGLQDLFVKTVSKCATVPVVVVVMSGSSVDYTPILKLDNIAALLWAGYPGQSGGQAIADIIFGKVSPSGRLNHNALPAEFLHEVAMTDTSRRPNPKTGSPGHHNFYTGRLVFPYGHGLTFARFSVDLVSIGKVSIPDDFAAKPTTLTEVCEFKFRVTNAAAMSMAGKYSVLLNLMPPSPNDYVRPPLTDFAKTRLLQPGDSTILTLHVHLHAVLELEERVVHGNYTWSVTDWKELTGTLLV